MPKEELDVFLSSDQDEFAKLRNLLSKKICSIPFLICAPLESRGADSTNVVESSLKAVRDSDIYVGIFGQDYSEITIKEYKEAVKCRKPCLNYVKKVKQRDDKLLEFIDDDLTNEFKYFEFRINKELIMQIDTDLKRFILETLKIGLEERTRTKQETKALIEKEEKVEPKVFESKYTLQNAESLFKLGNYLECLIMTTITLELSLRKILKTRNINAEGKSLGELIKMAGEIQIINAQQVNALREVSYFRNKAVHLGEVQNEATTRRVLEITKSILNRLTSQLTTEKR